MAFLGSQKHVFWQALLAAILIFGTGMLLGVAMENSRTDRLQQQYMAAELNLLDSNLQNYIFTNIPLECDSAVKRNHEFADKIYGEASLLEQFDESSTLTSTIKTLHRRYDLLRTILWLNSIEIKERCNADYHNFIYFYDYNKPGIEQRAEQIVFSRVLLELKEKRGSDILLIPIAADNELASVDLMLDKYNITHFPTILIDEETKITELQNVEELEELLE